MDKKPLNSHYDSEMDIFAVWLRQPDEVVCVEPEEGIVLRIDANTDEFVGYTILDFYRRFANQSPQLITLPLVPEFALFPLRDTLQCMKESG